MKACRMPNLKDDFYLNVLDWSPNGLIAVAIGKRIYSLTSSFSKLSCIYQDELTSYISSVNFSHYGRMGFGDSGGYVKIFDV